MAIQGTCACYFCEGDAVWQIWLAGEDELPEESYACELHARGHVHRAIVLPEQFDLDEPETVRDYSPPAL